MRIFILFFFILNLAVLKLKAEGTKELEPAAGQGRTKLEIGTDRVYNFGTYTSTPDKKIYIHIEDPATENINLGFGVPYHVGGDTIPLYYRIKDPSGNIVSPGALLPDSGKGFIKNYIEAAAGPKGLDDIANGYDPIVFKPTAKGDYVIEFSTNNKEEKNELKENRVLLDQFDVTVSKSNVKIPGRLWAYTWNLYSCGFSEKSYSKFYVYTKDSLVSSVELNGLNPCSFAVMFNSKGTTSSLQLAQSQKSGEGDIAFPEFKVFLNVPDSIAYGQDKSGVKLGKPLSVTGCSQGNFCININTIKGAKGTLLLDFNTNGKRDKEDLVIDLTLHPGDTCIGWNGADALGNIIPSGNKVRATLQLFKGLTNFPLYDAERNTNGFKANSYAGKLPGTPTPIYWDDSNLNLPSSAETTNLTGCLYSQKPTQGCHIWNQSGSQSAGNNNTFNSWWFASQTKDSVDFEIIQLLPVDAGEDKISCNSRSTINLGINERIPFDVQASWTELSSPGQTTILSPKQNNTKVNLNGTTKDSITYVLTHRKGSCIISDTVNILIDKKKKPAIIGKNSACSKGEEYYWANDDNAVRKKWSVPNGVISYNLFGDSIKIDSWGSGPLPRTEIIQVISEYANCPPDTGFKKVTLTAKIKTPKPVGDTLVCEGTKGNIYRVPFSRNTFQWMSDDRVSTTSNSNIINVNWPAPPYKHKIYVKENDSQGCMDFSDTLFVTIIPKKPIFLKRDTSICSNDTINLGKMVNLPSGATNFYWSPSTGINKNNIINPTFLLYRTSADTINYRVTASLNGCDLEDSIKVAVKPSAVITDIKNIIPCEDSLVVYNGLIKNATSIDWSVIDDSAKTVSYTPLNSTKDKIQIFWKSKQTPATVKLLVKGACGTDTASVRVIPRKYEHYPPSGPYIPCFSGDEILAYNVRSNGGKKFKWGITPADIGQFQGRTDTSEVKIKWTREGVAAIYVSEQGAEDSLCPVPPDTLYILITNKGLVDAGKDTTICKGTQATLKASGGISYVWFPKNKPGETLPGEIVTPTVAVTTDYIVKRTDKCKAQDTVKVTVRPLPAHFIDHKSPIEFCFDADSAALLLTANTGYNNYLWKPTLDTTSSISVTKNDMDSQDQLFVLYVTDTLGCTGADSILVSSVCQPRLYFPTGFSPNGDNINDKLEVFGNYFTNYEMKIYNRWGEVVFISQDRSKQWDGNYNGQPAPEGVYPWTVIYDSQKSNDPNNPYKIKGSITLIR